MIIGTAFCVNIWEFRTYTSFVSQARGKGQEGALDGASNKFLVLGVSGSLESLGPALGV